MQSANGVLTARGERGNWRAVSRLAHMTREDLITVPNPDLGVKRTCPETGKKFYDLNKDPIVSPFTGKEYPVSYFDEAVAKTTRRTPKPAPVEKAKAKEKPEEDAEETEDDEEADSDAPELDEEPIDLGEDEDEDDDTPKPKRKTAAAPEEDMDGFSDEEADLEEDDDDTGVLLDDDDDDDDLGEDISGDDDDN